MLDPSLPILVIYGGWSAEREASLQSGEAVIGALREGGHNVRGFDLTSDEPCLSTVNRLLDEIESAGIKAVYIALHGPFGEDGTIQGLLELTDIPYNGSGILASALGNDKVLSKNVFAANKVLTPRYAVLERGQAAKSCPLPLPVVVKPRKLGSSVGVSIVEEEGKFAAALETAASFEQDVLVESYIRGREIHAGILDGRPLPLVEVISRNRFYDYDAKYTPGKSEHRVPADLPKKHYEAVQRTAANAYKLLGCAGAARVDIIVEDTGTAYVIELNTLPGLTPTSLLPEAAREAGMSFLDLVRHELAGAMERHAAAGKERGE